MSIGNFQEKPAKVLGFPRIDEKTVEYIGTYQKKKKSLYLEYPRKDSLLSRIIRENQLKKSFVSDILRKKSLIDFHRKNDDS